MNDHNLPSFVNTRLREGEREQTLSPQQFETHDPCAEPPYPPFYHPPLSAPLSHGNPDDFHSGPLPYPSIQSYPPNFQRARYPTTPPMPPSQYHSSYGQHPIGMPAQYGHFPQVPNRSRSGVSLPYSDSQQSLQLSTSGGSPPLLFANPYALMPYAPPIPYPYSVPPPSVPALAPVYPSGNVFAVPGLVSRMNPAQELWYTSTVATTTRQPDLGTYSEHPAQSSRPLASVRPQDLGRPSAFSARVTLTTASQDMRWDLRTIPVPTDSAAQGAQDQRVSFPRTERSHSRRSQKAPPLTNRSEWVMWVGNIPSDCDHEELFRFFDSIVWVGDPHEDAGEDLPMTPRSGVVSVFLISQSNCAFVNYDSEDCLLNAVARCNGVAVRPDDQRCIKLVCRVRKKDEDLKTGVRAQRGVGMHTEWVQEQKRKGKPVRGDQVDNSLLPMTPTRSRSMYTPSPEHSDSSPSPVQQDDSSGSASYASTTSSFLATYFPQRYFILKSLTLEELQLSVERELWATQPHNEGTLDRAYRTSKEVFLIFGANKTGEFFGYAKMTGSILKAGSGVDSVNSLTQTLAAASTPSFQSSHPMPGPSRSGSAPGRFLTAPASTHGDMTTSPSNQAASVRTLQPGTYAEHNHLVSPNASPKDVSVGISGRGRTLIRDAQTEKRAPQRLPHQPVETPPTPTDNVNESPGPAARPDCGTSFAVAWIRVQPLPFTKTRHLRNPWNADREVKVSRDGTELEPDVGRQLVAQWDEPITNPPLVQHNKGVNSRSIGDRRG